MTAQIWFEDFTPGRVLTSPSRTITHADIDRYAELTGERDSVHMDEEFAKAAGFRDELGDGFTMSGRRRPSPRRSRR